MGGSPKYLTSKDPQNYHGEGDEGDEGDEACEHHREEQACEGYRVPRAQDEDREWAHEGGPVQEQALKIVSRKQSSSAKKRFTNTLGPWCSALTKARKALNLRGFVAVNGKTAQGRALYAKAKSFYSK